MTRIRDRLLLSYGAAATPPDFNALKTQLIADLTSDGIWSLMSKFYMLCAPDSALAKQNWVAAGTNDLVEVGAVTFTANQGYATDGTTGQLNLNGLLANSGFMTATNAGLGIFTLTRETFNEAGAGANDMIITGTPVGGTVFGRIGASNSFNGIAPNSMGHQHQDRTGTAQARFFNGVKVHTNTATNFAFGANQVRLLNNAGGGFSQAGAVMACAYFGQHLTDAQVATLYTRLNAFIVAQTGGLFFDDLTFNLNNTSKTGLKAAMDASRNGTSSPIIGCVGDSTEMGFHSDGTVLGLKSLATMGQLAADINSTGVNGVTKASYTGFFAANSVSNTVTDYPTYNPMVAVGSPWTYVGKPTSVGGSFWQNATNAGTLAYTPGNAFTRIYLAYLDNGNFTVDVDGSQVTTFNTGNTGAFLQMALTVTAGTTINIKPTAGNAGTISIIGCEAYVDADHPLRIWQMGWSGSASADWDDTSQPYSTLNVLTKMADFGMTACFINLGINDWRVTQTGSSLPSYVTNMRAIVTALKAHGCTPILCVPVQSQIGGSPTQATITGYINALYDLAHEQNVPLVDLRQDPQLATYVAANAASMMFDGLHPNQAGYAEVKGVRKTFMSRAELS